MSTYTRVKTFVANETLTASDLNNEFNNIITNTNSANLNSDNVSTSAAWTWTGVHTMSTSSSLNFNDDIYIKFGTAPDYLLRYNNSNTALELTTSNSDGSGTDATVIDIQDGTDDVRIRGGLATDNNTAPTTGLKVGGVIVSDTDSTDDLGTTSVRWANVYTDAIGDTGQALTVKSSDVTVYHDANNADVAVSMGTSASEAAFFESLNGSSNKTLEEFRITTKTASGTANHGKVSFHIDEAAIATVDDSGINLESGMTFRINGTSIDSGDVQGPGSSTDNATMRFDGTGGKTAQNSGVIIDDSNNVSGIGTLGVSGVTTVGGNIVSDTDSTDDLGTSSVRWANVYTDKIGDSGQALSVGAGTLSFDAAATIDSSGNNAITIDSGSATLSLDAGTIESDATTLSFDSSVSIDSSGNNAITVDAGTATLTLDGGTIESDATTLSFDSTISIDTSGNNAITIDSGSATMSLDAGTIESDATTLSFDAATSIDTSGNNNLTLSAGTATLVVTAGDVTIYDDNSDADTSLAIGTSATEALFVQAQNGSNKTLEELRFLTKTASGTGNHGKMSFHVDDVEIATIDDDGIDLAAGMSYTVNGSAIGGASLSGSTANTLVTVTGANALTGEADVTYDASTEIFQIASDSASLPVFTLKNTNNGATSASIKFVNDKGAAGADNDVCGTIEFFGDDDNQDNIRFAKIEGVVADASNGDECGSLKFYVAENDGNNTVGLQLTGSTTDGEVDVTIGAGAASTVSIPGDIALTGGIDLGSDATGDMYYRDGSGHLARIAVGSDNHVLTLNGTTPGWEAAAGGGGTYNDWAIKTTNYTASNGDQLICNHASTPFTITLPSSPSGGHTVTIKNCGAANVTIARNSEEIDEVAADGTLPKGNAVQLVFVDGTIDSWMSL